MEWSLHVAGVRNSFCLEDRPKWHPGYFHPSVHRCLDGRTPSPNCTTALDGEPAWHSDSSTTNLTSSSSSLHLSRLSNSTYVSDSSATSSSDASASGDNLKKRKNFRKIRGLKRQPSFRIKRSNDEGIDKQESPSAAYCEQWIFKMAAQPVEDHRKSFSGLPENNLDNEDVSLKRHSMGNFPSSPKKNLSWSSLWENLLKLNQKTKKPLREPVAITIDPAGAKRPTLPSISEVEGGMSETLSCHSIKLVSLAPSSASSSVTACNSQSNPTNEKVCLFVVGYCPLFSCE